MKITVTGRPGSGQSTLAKLLAETLCFTYGSAGRIFRKFSGTYSYAMSELESFSISYPTMDLHTDETTRLFGRSNDSFVYEGMLAWHFIPDAVKVFVCCELPTRIERRASVLKVPAAVAAERIAETERCVEKRFRRLHDIRNWTDTRHFNLLVDSTRTLPDALCDQVVHYMEQGRYLIPKLQSST